MNLDQDRPFPSELFGAPHGETDKQFGVSWRYRTSGLGAIRIEWTKQGVHRLDVKSVAHTNHSKFKSRFAASKDVFWFKLIKGEYLTEILFRESETHNRITTLRFRTNKRPSQWYGSGQGTLRKITAPCGYYIHMIHGSNKDGALRNIGAYFVPLSLKFGKKSCVWVADSEVIGDVACDFTSKHCFWSGAGAIRAIVVQISEHLERVRSLSIADFSRCLEVAEDPLDEGEHVLVFAESERIKALRGCVVDGRVTAIQFDTTHRTTEWIGPVPSADAVVETRSIADVPTATHIGRVFLMVGGDHIKSIGVGFYKSKKSG